MTGAPASPASSSQNAREMNAATSSRPPERSLADLLDSAEQELQLPRETEEPQGWELIFDFHSGLSSGDIPGDVDVSTMELASAGGVGVTAHRKDLPLASGQGRSQTA